MNPSIALLHLLAGARRKQPCRIAHVVNPFECPEEHPSYLHYAQPITFASMRRAKERARRRKLDVSLCAACFEAEGDEVPVGFERLPSLSRSVATEYPELTDRSLPFVADILQRLYEHTDAELLVLTNVDIGLYEDFYQQCALIYRAGYDAFTITRRNNLPKQLNGKRLGPEDLDLIYRQRGAGHPGHDCFVFHRNLWPKLSPGQIFTGFPPWGTVLRNELRKKARKFREFQRLIATFHLGRDTPWKSAVKHPLWLQNIEEARRLGYEIADLN